MLGFTKAQIIGYFKQVTTPSTSAVTSSLFVPIWDKKPLKFQVQDFQAFGDQVDEQDITPQ